MKDNKFKIGQQIFTTVDDLAVKDFISVIAKESSHPDANLCYKLQNYPNKGWIREDKIFASEQEFRAGVEISDLTN